MTPVSPPVKPVPVAGNEPVEEVANDRRNDLQSPCQAPCPAKPDEDFKNCR